MKKYLGIIDKRIVTIIFAIIFAFIMLGIARLLNIDFDRSWGLNFHDNFVDNTVDGVVSWLHYFCALKSNFRKLTLAEVG